MREKLTRYADMSNEQLADQVLKTTGRPDALTFELAVRLRAAGDIHVDTRTRRAWVVDRTGEKPRMRLSNVTFTGLE